jgi:hypothetical protein
MNITYTVLSPADVAVTVVCSSFAYALDLAEADLARGWAPETIRYGRQRWDIDGIRALLDARYARQVGA